MKTQNTQHSSYLDCFSLAVSNIVFTQKKYLTHQILVHKWNKTESGNLDSNGVQYPPKNKKIKQGVKTLKYSPFIQIYFLCSSHSSRLFRLYRSAVTLIIPAPSSSGAVVTRSTVRALVKGAVRIKITFWKATYLGESVTLKLNKHFLHLHLSLNLSYMCLLSYSPRLHLHQGWS